MHGAAPAVEMIEITKVFPGVVANDRVNLTVQEGEIHALLGENGAGKSTLMSVLFGMYEADGGRIMIHGKEAGIRNPNDAVALGIGMVHQHFRLVRNFTAAENIVLGLERRNRFGNLDMAAAEWKAAELSAAYGLAVDPRSRIENMTVGMQQRVEILKTLYRNADILIFDEPTAVLTPQEIDELLLIFNRLKAEGKTIIFITHKLKEIKAAADRCTVLRRGRTIDTVAVKDADEMELAEKMVGRAVNFNLERKPACPGGVVLRIENLRVDDSRRLPAVNGFSLDVRAGEVVGIAGVDGNGQAELAAAVYGLLPVKSGRILFKGRDITRVSIRERIKLGIAFVPDDRQRYGVVLDFYLYESLMLKGYRKPPFARNLIDQFDIRAEKGPLTRTGDLSGGNQQKAVIARELSLSPELLIVAQPTRGLDVGAVEYIHRRILAERDAGRAVLLISFELDEILGLCDRIAAISRGALAGIVSAEEAEERRIGAMMGGFALPDRI
ncbi:MAG: ABC transporter ATP-binding protein [Spirochaetaceae bacterium]|jgi:simple sugar transport system ATP-binding protein|nr:ABC transporter ATP-binding protein [Spirochaetaceae bacterium]